MKLHNLALTTLGAIAFAAPVFAGTAAKNPSPMPASAPEELGITVGLNYDSRLIYHGINFGEHYLSGDVSIDVPLTSALNGVIDLSYGNVFDSAFDGTDYQRLTIGAGVSTELGPVELGVGYRWIHHEDVPEIFAEDGHEIGVTLATKAGPLNVGLGTYYDFADDGWYFELAVNSEIKISDMVSIVPGVAVGYGIDYAANRTAVNAGLDDGFIAVTPSIAMPFKISERTTITPYVASRIAIDALDDSGADDYLYGGISLRVRF